MRAERAFQMGGGMKNKLALAAAMLLTPVYAQAEDFNSFLPMLSLPFVFAGIIAALIFTALIKKNRDDSSSGPALRRWFIATLIPGALGLLLMLLNLAEGKWESQWFSLLIFSAYGAAFYAAFRADFLSRKLFDDAARLKKVLLVGLPLLWVVSALLGIAGSAAKEAAWEARLAAERVRYPEPTDDERRASRRKNVLIDLRKQIMKDGRTVGEAMATDPALGKRIMAALERDELFYPPVNDLEYHTRFNKEALGDIGIELQK